ncbi:MAG: tripartite tricarboxylate transporter substrate binding protein [Rhodovarius sp.]|nr:tripartite tricarboxylate transporter substrate binding protein [Rhodovarius sp.]
MSAITRRLALAAPPALLAAPALAQGRWLPERPIRMIIPWPPGGSADAQMRAMTESVSRTLGQPVVVENRPGAGGTMHAVHLAREARPDGHTIGQMHFSIIRRPFLVRQPQWDAVRDFTHIIGLAGWLFGVAVRAEAPWRDFREMIEDARRRPGRISFATSGVATTNHLAMEQIMEREGVQLLHVPFRGSNEALPAVLNGQVDMVADSSTWAPMVEAGRMRLLCVWSAERARRFPDAPTLRELGYDMVVTSNYGLSGPPGMEPRIVRSLHDAFKEALLSPENARVREQYDMPLVYMDSEQYTAFIRERAEFERALIARLGIRME